MHEPVQKAASRQSNRETTSQSGSGPADPEHPPRWRREARLCVLCYAFVIDKYILIIIKMLLIVSCVFETK